MSFILDALKKSEVERQRQTIPGLVDSGTPRPRARLPRWAIGLCALLAVNLLVLLVVLIRGGSHPAAAPSVHRTEATPAPAGAAPASDSGNHFSPLDAEPVYAPEIAPGAAPTQTAAPPAERPAGSHTVRRRDPLLSSGQSPADDETLPTINELNLTGAAALPDLHLDVHVFATRAADRFVYINMRKYREGAALQEGPTLERIRRDGVVLDYQGLRFLLPRQ